MPSSSRVRRRPRLDAPTLDRLVAALPLTQAVGTVRVQALAAGAELHLVGTIGEEITAAGVLAALQGIGGDVPLTVRINSPGGSVFEGFAIYNALARRPGTSTVFIEGVAASIASLIAMAGAEIVMPGNAFLMLHNPSGLALGTSIDMRGLADLLDRLAGAMVAIYAQRSGQTPETVQQLMDAETWLDAPGAVELGFADRVEAPETVAACFDLSRFKNTPPAAPRAVTFPEPPRPAPVPLPETPAPHQETPMPANTNSAGAFATAAELRAIAARAHLDDRWVLDQLEAQATADAARERALDAMAARQPQRGGTVSNDPLDRHPPQIAAMEAALVARVRGIAPQGHAREYMGVPMAEMARELLELRGEGARRWPITRVVAAALHTTSDFPALLQRVTNATLLEAYQAAQSPLAMPLARVFTGGDGTRDVRVVRAPEFPVLERIIEHQEITRGSATDTAEGFTIKTFARIFGLTEDAIRRDYLGGFAAMVDTTAKAAAETEAQELVGLLNANGGAGVKLFDGKALFHADRSNTGTAALSIEGLSTARQAMRRTKSLNGGALAAVTPKFLLVAPEQETLAEQVLAQIAAATPGGVNPFAGRVQPLVEPRLDGLGWYLFADPAEAPVIGTAYFDGEAVPRVDTRVGWEVLGMEVRAVLDFGAGVIGWRGAYRSTGAG